MIEARHAPASCGRAERSSSRPRPFHRNGQVAAIKGATRWFCDAGQDVRRKISLLKAYGADVVVCPTNVERESPQSLPVADRRRARSRAHSSPTSTQPAQPGGALQDDRPRIRTQTGGKVDVSCLAWAPGHDQRCRQMRPKGASPPLLVSADPEARSTRRDRALQVEGVGGTSCQDDGSRSSTRSSGHRQAVFVAARRLAREGDLVGGSSGLALHAAMEVARERKPGDVIIVLFPDFGRNTSASSSTTSGCARTGTWQGSARCIREVWRRTRRNCRLSSRSRPQDGRRAST